MYNKEVPGGAHDGGLGVVPATGGRVNVIYCRYSSELQRSDSIQDQDRRCREGLERMGIPPDGFILVADEAVTGTSENRTGFEQLKGLIYSGRLGILAATEQSRVSRGDNAKALIKDIVFHGGRFISMTEGIDTTRKGWKTIVGISEIHHSRSNEDTAERVRGAQEGRVRDGHGSAGDLCYGYASEYEDPVAAAACRGRGGKPKRRVVVQAAAAAVVHDVFTKFAVARESIGSIVRWWEAHKDHFPPITRTGIHHQHVRRILTNRKYVGEWTYGATTTVYDGSGRKKQVPARSDQNVTVVQRPGLRIVGQALWDAAQARLAELLRVYGMKPAGKKRGPSEHYRLLYPKRVLNGLVDCQACGRRMTEAAGGGVRRLGCPNHRAGTCPVAGRVPYAKAEAAILGALQAVLSDCPPWLQQAVAAMREALHRMSVEVPKELAADRAGLAGVEGQIDHLVRVLGQGFDSPAVRSRLSRLEGQQADLLRRMAEREQFRVEGTAMPDDAWLQQQFQDLATMFKEELPAATPLIRSLLGKVMAEEVVACGKKRGFMRLHVRIDGWALLSQALVPGLPASLLAALRPPERDASSGEFVLDLGAPTRMDHWAPQIVQWRQQGVTWAEISRRTGLKIANAYAAFKRWKGANRAA